MDFAMPVRPPRLLSLESATDALSVAVLEGERVVALEVATGTRQHSAALLSVVDTALRRAGLPLAEIDAMALSAGPGSFTSLRIGLATVKGLAFGREIPTIGVSTLEAMAAAALAAGSEREVLALLDARRGEVYAGTWCCAGRGEWRASPMLVEGLYDAARLAAELRGAVVAVSPDAAVLRADLERAGLAVSHWIEGEAAAPRADWVGRIARHRLDRGEGETAATLSARYVRRAQAEAQRLGRAVEDGPVARSSRD